MQASSLSRSPARLLQQEQRASRANLVFLDAATIAHTFVARPARKAVVSNGKIAARAGVMLT
jgi:hypothetical protein